MVGIPGRDAVTTAALGAVAKTVEVAGITADIPGRLLRLVEQTEALLVRVEVLIARMEELAGTVTEVVDRAGGTVTGVEALVPRAATTVSRAEEVIGDVSGTVARAQGLVEASQATVGNAEAVIAETGRLTDRATGTLNAAARAAETAEALLNRFEPMLVKAAPMAQRFVDELSAEEVEAAIQLVDELPALTTHVRDDILPILATLDRVGPDISELLKVTYDVRRAVLGIPGFGFLRKRGAERLEDEQDEERELAEAVAPRDAREEGDRK